MHVCVHPGEGCISSLECGKVYFGDEFWGDIEILLHGHVQVCEWISELGPGLDPFQPAPRSPHRVVLPVITADKLLQLRAAVPGWLPAVRPQAAPWESIHFNKRYTLCY